jgi:hypothetical protein
LKNVTAADVASSLYYFHLNTEDDARFLEEDQPAIIEETAAREKPLPRKPLPESARSSLDLNHQMTSVSLNPGANSGMPRRKPVTTEPAVPVPQQQPSQRKQNVSRRPLGPRPLIQEPTSTREYLPGVENKPWTSTSQPRDIASALRTSNETAMNHPFEDIAASRMGINNDETFSITLIRRDPASGAQWNIGHVSGYPASNESSHGRTSPKNNTKKGYFDISIQLSTPGYGPFRAPAAASHSGKNTVGGASHSGEELSTDQPQTPTTSDWSFDRQVRMAGSSFWSRPSIQHRRTLSDLSINHNSTRGRSSSGGSDVGLVDIPRGSYENDPDVEDAQSKGYMFVSPWGGRCKFSTRGNGRSLRCKHTLPAPVSASNTTQPTSSQHISEPVSELRFNLPSAALFSSSTINTASKRSFDSGRPKFSNLRKKLSPHKTQPPLPTRPHPTSYAAMYPSDNEEAPPLPPRSYHVTDSSEEEAPPPLPARLHPFPFARNASHEDLNDDDPHLDLSIGQEKAGGGNRGKRAKLGKLIVHHEGFKMLDLVVAANIGVWWSVWETVPH